VLQRVGYLALMLLVDEAHETLMMVTNSMKNDLADWHDHWIIINALTALANICSASMARDLASDVERLADGSILLQHGISGAAAGHIRKKALLACSRMASRAPELAGMFKELPATGISDGNHAVVMACALLSLLLRL
jgi:AP-1 complex subunit gamma-1